MSEFTAKPDVSLRPVTREWLRANCQAAYREFVAADERFQAALVAEFGKNAGDYRYQPDRYTPAIRALAAEFDAAGERWRTLFLCSGVSFFHFL